MTMNYCRVLLLVVLFTIALVVRAGEEWEETILTPGARLEPGTYLRSEDKRCSLKLQGDGNLISKRKGLFWRPGSDDLETRINWTSGAKGGGNYYAMLQDTGNLEVVERGSGQVVWTTRVPPPTGTDVSHRLVFTQSCALRIKRFERTTYDPDGFEGSIWANINDSLDNFSADTTWGLPGHNNVIGKGEYYSYPYGLNHGEVCGTGTDFCFRVPFTLTLQHDCNLVVFVGSDRADKSAVVWSANVTPQDASDCYLLVDSNDVALYEGSFDPTAPENSQRPGKYWSVPPSFFDDNDFVPGRSTYQVLINNEGQLYLDWD